MWHGFRGECLNQYLRLLLEHNPRHYTNIRGYKVCSRCLGSWIAGLVSFVIFGIIFYLGFVFGFWQVALISLTLGFLCFFNWVSCKTKILSMGNTSRIISGVFLGTGISLWFWLLPVDWFTRIWTLLLIETVFTIIVVIVNYHEFKHGLFDMYQDWYNKRYNKMFCCDLGCCSTVCCMGPKICCILSFVLCCCCCPILLFLLLKKGI